MTLNNSMLITPLPPAQLAGKRFEHGSNLDGKIRPFRVSSQWKSTPTQLDEVDAYLVMAGRLTELPVDRVRALVAAMKTKSRGVLFYAFDDWLKRSSLDEMAAKLQVALSSDGVTTDIAAARWLA